MREKKSAMVAVNKNDNSQLQIGVGARKLLQTYLDDVLNFPQSNAISKRTRKIDPKGWHKFFLLKVSFNIALFFFSCGKPLLDDGNNNRSFQRYSVR